MSPLLYFVKVKSKYVIACPVDDCLNKEKVPKADKFHGYNYSKVEK